MQECVAPWTGVRMSLAARCPGPAISAQCRRTKRLRHARSWQRNRKTFRLLVRLCAQLLQQSARFHEVRSIVSFREPAVDTRQ